MAVSLLHRTVRRLTTRYPSLRGTGWFTRAMERAAPARGWFDTESFGNVPAMALDLDLPFHRRIFYFPLAYRRCYLDQELDALLQRTLFPGAIFVDIGANLGFVSLRAAELVGASGHVYAFEPEARTFASLSRSVALQRQANISAIPVALADVDERQRFYRATMGTSHSLVPEADGHEARYEDTTEVRVATFDTIARDLPIELSRIALVKIDVEGVEARTLEGMRASLPAAGRPPVWIEVRGPEGSTRSPETFRAVLAVVQPLGYRPFQIVDGTERGVSVDDVRGREDVLLRCSDE